MKLIEKKFFIIFTIVLCGCQVQRHKEVEIYGYMESPYIREENIILQCEYEHVTKSIKKINYRDFPEEQNSMFFNQIINELQEIRITFNKYEGFNLEYKINEENKEIDAILSIDYTLFPSNAYASYIKKEGIKNNYKVNLAEELEFYRSLPEYIIYEY